MAINLNIVSKFDDKGIKQVTGQLDGVGKTLGKLGGVLAAAFSVKAIADFTKEAILAAEGVATANARIENIAQSMGIFGDEAGKVTDRLVEYAEANELLFATDAEVIKATQAKLLTFKELANTADETGGSFDRATQAAIDLAAAGFGAAETNAIQLGKALNDPIKGISALTRSGVTFTASEKELIKTLVESGDTLAAQEMILAAIETQVGGTAAATADASVQMGLAFDNVKETIGAALLPAFEGITSALIPLIDYFMPILEDFMLNKVSPALETAAGAFGGFVQAIVDGNLIEKFIEIRTSLTNAFIELIPQMVDAVMKFLPAVIQTLADMIPKILEASIKTFMALVDALVIILPEVLRGLMGMLPQIVATIVGLLPSIIQSAITLFTGLITALVKVIPQLIKAFYEQAPAIIDAIIDALPLIINAAFELFSGLIEGLIDAIPDIIDAVVDLIPVITKALIDNLPKIVEAGMEIVKGLAKGILENAPRLLGEAVATLGNTLVDGVKNLLGIRSPSKVFEEIGQNVGAGLINGMDSKTKAVVEAASKLAKAATPKGFEWVMGPNGPYLEMSSFVSGQSEKGVSDFGAASASFLMRQQGLSQEEIDRVLTESIGGTLAQVNATMNRGVTLINEATNTMTMGNLSDSDIADKIAQGFKVVDKIAAPIEDLNGAISDLINTIQTSGTTAYLTPMATGGIVTGPTPALVGEAGPEAIIPLSKLGEFGGTTYQITVNAGIGTDGGEVGRQIVEAIKRYERRSGRVFATA